MTEIPEDIMKAAKVIAQDSGFAYGKEGAFKAAIIGDSDVTEEITWLGDAIAAALMAERQRCAEIARTWVDDPYVGSAIAEVIMEGGEA